MDACLSVLALCCAGALYPVEPISPLKAAVIGPPGPTKLMDLIVGETVLNILKKQTSRIKNLSCMFRYNEVAYMGSCIQIAVGSTY